MAFDREAYYKWLHKVEWLTRPEYSRPSTPTNKMSKRDAADLMLWRKPPKTKRCRVCGFELPADQFNKAPANSDGLQTICRECARIERRKYREGRKG